MPKEPNIKDVRVTRGETKKQGKAVTRLDITIAVENSSSNETIYVSVSLRYVSYSSTTKELTISTAEPAKTNFEIHQFMIPTVVPIEPGKAIPVRLQVPLKLTQILGIKDKKLVTETADLSSVTSFKVGIAFAPTSFRPIPKQTAGQMRQQFLSWQTLVEKIFERKIE